MSIEYSELVQLRAAQAQRTANMVSVVVHAIAESASQAVVKLKRDGVEHCSCCALLPRDPEPCVLF